MRTVDLFAGCGGLSLGTHWAIRAAGARPRCALAVDSDPDSLEVFSQNLAPEKVHAGSVRELLRPDLLTDHGDLNELDPECVVLPAWPRDLSEIDLLVGGPPCQGHSNLNNLTRRRDSRNELYLWMGLAALVLRPKLVIVENVPAILRDHHRTLDFTRNLMRRIGYTVGFEGVLEANRFGVAQRRKRHFLVAVLDSCSSSHGIDLASEFLHAGRPIELTVQDAIGDLENAAGDSSFDDPSELSPENRERIEWLFRNDRHDLPDELRPDCHRDGHTYPSVYGRMHGDRPAPTLSTGFLSPGRGRFIHPSKPRALTLHEGARLQGFPDDFRFASSRTGQPGRAALSGMIGRAVPPPLAFHVALAALAMIDMGARSKSHAAAIT